MRRFALWRVRQRGVTLSDEEWELVGKLAKEAGMSRSEYIRQLIPVGS